MTPAPAQVPLGPTSKPLTLLRLPAGTKTLVSRPDLGVPNRDNFFLVPSSTSAPTEGEFRIFSDPVLSVAHSPASPCLSRTPRPPHQPLRITGNKAGTCHWGAQAVHKRLQHKKGRGGA